MPLIATNNFVILVLLSPQLIPSTTHEMLHDLKDVNVNQQAFLTRIQMSLTIMTSFATTCNFFNMLGYCAAAIHALMGLVLFHCMHSTWNDYCNQVTFPTFLPIVLIFLLPSTSFLFVDCMLQPY